MRVLVITHDREIQVFMKELLEKYNCIVEGALSLDVAIGSIRKRPFDIFVIDDICEGKRTSNDLLHELQRVKRISDIILISSSYRTSKIFKSKAFGTRVVLEVEKGKVFSYPYHEVFKKEG